MTQPPPNSSKPRRALIVTLVVVAALGGLAVLFGLLAGVEAEAEPGDRERVITAQDFSDHFELDLAINPARESLTRQKYLDGSYSVDYEYTSPDETFYLSTSIAHERSAKDARAVYTGTTVSLDVVFKTLGDGVEPDEVPGLVTRGDDSEAGWLNFEGHRTGAYAVVLVDDEVLTFMMAGFELEPEGVRALLEPCLAGLSR
jgi:hypothetical protein